MLMKFPLKLCKCIKIMISKGSQSIPGSPATDLLYDDNFQHLQYAKDFKYIV